MTDPRELERDLRTRSRVLRALVLIGAPLVFFVAVETVLAIVGFGGRQPLFIESADLPGMREPNPRVVQRYFPGRETKLGIDPIPFRSEELSGAVRIVVQGGSTAAGFPYGRWAGLAGMLGDRLEAVHPDREI